MDRAARPGVGSLLVELQSYGVRVEAPMEGRRGGAGPADAGMVYIEGFPVTIPFAAEDQHQQAARQQSQHQVMVHAEVKLIQRDSARPFLTLSSAFACVQFLSLVDVGEDLALSGARRGGEPGGLRGAWLALRS